MKIFALILSLILTSCSVNYHLNKAIKKGYRVVEFADTIRITSIDSFPVIVHDSIVWEKVITKKDTIIRYSAPQVPKTRFQIRFDKKRFSDSLNTIRNMYSDSLDAAVKMHKQETKQNVQFIRQKTRQIRHENKKGANLFLFGLATGIILTLIVRYAINQALKKFA